MQAPAVVRPRIPVWLVILFILSLLTIAAWPFVAFMSAFAFDSPGSSENPAVWTGVITVLSYPLLPLLGIPAAFFAYRANRKVLAYVLTGIGAIPLAAVVLVVVMIVVGNLMFMLKGGL